jgi:hypothetical protein
MRKLAMAIVLVAMLAIGLAGVAGAAEKCDAAKDGTCCEDSAKCQKSSHGIFKKKKSKTKKAAQPQPGQGQTTPGSQGTTK